MRKNSLCALKDFLFSSKTFICSFVFLFLMLFGVNFAGAAALPTGGTGFSSAVSIQPGTYQGGALTEGQDLYYRIFANAGQQIKLVDNITPTEPLYGVTHEITLYDENQNELMNDDNGNNPFVVYWLAGAGKSTHNYYLKISDVTWDTASFSLSYSLSNYFDANSQTDAGENFDKPISLGVGNYTGYLAGHPYLALQVGDDIKDYYKVAVTKGVSYEFKAIPETKGSLTFEMFNVNREILDEKSSANEGAAITLSLTPAANTDVYLALSDAYSMGNSEAGDLLDYSLSVKSSATALTKYYNCTNGACGLAGSFASSTDCQATTTKICYPSANCDNKCGSVETFACLSSADCPTNALCVAGQCIGTGGKPIGACENECSSGQTKCFDNFNYYKCGDYNKDGCYEWASPVYCGEGNKCDNGKCTKAAGCQCSEWQDSECEGAGCAEGQMAKTRTCTPAACDIEKMCQSDASCGTIILPPSGFDIFALLATMGIWTWFGGFFIIFWIAAYVYFALCLMVLAKKTGTKNEWMAWIPIANIFLMINIAKKPLWWFILIFVPLVNIVIAVILWMAIAERRGKENWLGILIIVPAIGILIPGYLAFFDNGKSGKTEPPSKPYNATGIAGADKPTVGYKHACKYCEKLIPPNSVACPFCEKVNPLGPDRCPKCHNPIEKEWKVCANCNQNLRIVCPYCGKVTFFGDHCEDCGKRLLVTCPNCGQEQPPIGDNCIKCDEPLKPKKK
jgi:hypothetical protein